MGNPTSLGVSGGPQLVDNIRQLDERQAIATVVQLSVQLRGKSGVLQAINANDPSRTVSFERKSWWQFAARSADNKTRTADALKALVAQAGLDTAPLDRYLAERGGRAGTRTLSTVLERMVNTKNEAAPQPDAGERPSVIARPSVAERQPPSNEAEPPVRPALSLPEEPPSLAPLQNDEIARVQPAVVEHPVAENVVQEQIPEPQPLTAKEQMGRALSTGRYTEAAQLMTGRDPRPTPAEMARELVDEHYDGRALPTRLVQFAVAAFTGADGTADAAQFLLAAYDIPHEAPADFDVGRLRPLADSILLWQASDRSDVDALAAAFRDHLDVRFADIESVKTAAQRLFAPRLADRLDLDQLGEAIEYAESDEEAKTLKQQLRDRAANVIERNGYLALSARDADSYLSALSTLSPVTKQRLRPTMALGNRTLLAGCTMRGEDVMRVENSVLRNPAGGATGASLRNCVIRGLTGFWNVARADLTGSEITLQLDNYRDAQMYNVVLTGAILDDAEVRIDYSALEKSIQHLQANGHAPEATLVQVFNHFDNAPMQRGPLTAIDSIDDRYGPLKVKLMREALAFCAKYDAVGALSRPWSDILMRNPIYLADPEIRRLATPLIEPLLRELGARTEWTPDHIAVFTALVDGGSASPAARAVFIRDNMDVLNAALHAVDRNPQLASQPEVARAIAAIRADRDALPELAPLKAMLDTLYMDYTRSDGQTVAMPWYFMLAPDGAVAALDIDHFGRVMAGDAGAKLIENTMFFLPDAQKYGTANADYYAVEDSQHVMLAPGNIKDRAPGLISRFAPLKAHYEKSRPTPGGDIVNRLFSSDPAVMGWFNDAFKGLSPRLDLNQIITLGEAFRKGAPAIFEDFTTIANPQQWPDTRLSAGFSNSLRDLGRELAGVAPGDQRAFAHFLFSLSATFTRLSSEKVFGDGANSVSELRYLGYALFNASRSTQPDLLSADTWTELENRFLRRANAFDCAEILSRMQFAESRAIDRRQYEAFTPGVFRNAA